MHSAAIGSPNIASVGIAVDPPTMVSRGDNAIVGSKVVGQ
jgi:hypothetical protein